MRVLGIDPGSRYLGFGVLDWRAGKPVYVAHGVVRAEGKGALPERLRLIHRELEQVVQVYAPEAVAVEGVFTHKNARSALILGHARGVALLLAAQHGLAVFEYAPARVKRAVGAGGNDGKDAVARMVTTLLRLEEKLERADAYDALAVALCHAFAARSPLAMARPSGRRAAATEFAARLTPAFVPARKAAS